MLRFFHQFQPQPIFFQFGWLTIRWYGLLMALSFIIGIFILTALGRKKGIKSDDVYDLAFWLVIGGIIGARLYEVFFINWDYYKNNLSAIFKIWQGGLAIHGAIIAGLIVLWFWAKKKKFSFWLLTDLLAVPLALGQAIGRWGNYFNQELFGPPTNLPWGIPIGEANRPALFMNEKYFQPAFLYESILDLVLFLIIIRAIKRGARQGVATVIYFLGYGLIRFFMEFVRIDETPNVLGLRLPQLASLLIILAAIFIWAFLLRPNNKKS
ncbi:MAG: prolipoprotein diacylglyceryl transferase [Patescibacteria group bacterium]